MTLNLVFPVNNKGGVGKTSVLADLGSALAQRYSLGVLDFDDQASLAGTLLRVRKSEAHIQEFGEEEEDGSRPDFVCKDLEAYDLAVHDVELNPARDFTYSDILSRLTIRVAPTRAKVCVFPAGMIYEDSEKKEKLEAIVKQGMKRPTFVAADLPPIPHPGMIFDYTIQPLIDSFAGDVRLFPLIIATPDHNVIDIALRGYAKIARYFQEKGVPADRIHPMFVLNKAPLQEKDGKVTTSFDESIGRKLGKLGIIHFSEFTGSGINCIKRSFDYDGTRYRSVVFPHFDDVQEGCFSLMFNQELSLAQYPHLVDMVNSHKYPINEQMDARRRVFMYSLRELVNFISAKSEEQPTKNYTKSKEFYDIHRMNNETVDDLRRVIEDYYRTEKVTLTTNVTEWQYGHSSAEEWFGIPKTMTEDQMTTIVYRTLLQVDPSSKTTEDEVRQAFQKKDEYDNGIFTICDREGYELIGVEYNTNDPTRVRLGIPRKNKRFPGKKPRDIDMQLSQLETFYRNFGQVCGK